VTTAAAPRMADDLMADDVIRDPFTYYRWLRELDPIHWNARWGGWVLTRYEDVVTVLRDATTFSSDRMGYLAAELSPEEQAPIFPIFDVLSRWMVFADPPVHTTLRMLMNRQFTPKAVEGYRPTVRKIVDDLIDELEPLGQMDLVRDFAYQIPMTVILDLMGTPDLDRTLIKQWSEMLGTFFFIRADEPKRREIATEGVQQLVDYLEPVIEDRAKNMGDDDLISLLLRAEQEGKISRKDVVATCVLLVFGGHETTMNLIANGSLALIHNPKQWRKLSKHPEIAKSAVEELLRYDGSVKATVRWAKDDFELGGKQIKSGERILLALSAANRDPEQFEDPDSLDLIRSPNHHVAFAHGIHVCIGAPLARLEAQETFAGLTARLPRPQLETDQPEYFRTVVGRALKHLPVRW
jgi:cytochrome P450